MKPKLLLGLALVLGGNCFAGIIYPPAPDGGQPMVYHLASTTLQQVPGFFGGLRVEDLIIAEPYQSYHVGTSNLLGGKLVASAQLNYGGGWQYLLTHGTNEVGIAYLKADEKTGKALKCSQIGPYHHGRLEALRIAEQLPQVKKQGYELRSLDLPWFFFQAVWLHGKSDDIFIPLPDNWNRWKAYQPCSESEMIRILKPVGAGDMEKGKTFWQQKAKDEAAFSHAMADYEKAHGGKCGTISYEGVSGPFQEVAPRVEVFELLGKSIECGKLVYKVKVTYKDDGHNAVENVDVLEKLTQ